MKKGIFIILLLQVSFNNFSQNLLKSESEKLFYDNKNIDYFYVFDNVTYSISNSFLKREIYLHKDSVITDTLKAKGKIVFDNGTKKYYFMETINYGSLFKLDINNGKTDLITDLKISPNIIYNNKIPKTDSVNLPYNMPIFDGYNRLQGYKKARYDFAFLLSIYDIENKSKEILADFSENIKEQFISQIVGCVLLKDKVIFYTGYDEAGDIYNKQYWTVDINSKILNKIVLPEDYKETYYMPDFTEENIIIFKDNYNTIDALIFDKDTQQNTGKILYRRNETKGFVTNKNTKTENFYKTHLDDYTRMLILDDTDIKRELALFKIYDNQILNNIENLDLNDLNILKNMIFAKHNYKFDNKYYQAYFNLYRFYNSPDKHKTRTKKVNHLLTETDKQNLKLIKKAIKQKT